MSIIEKFFVQIFETKQRILDQVKEHVESYDRACASKLLVQGIYPPSWLLNSVLRPPVSDSQDIKREELIPRILLRRPQLPVSYPTYQSLNNSQAVSAATEQISDGFIKSKDATDNILHHRSLNNSRVISIATEKISDSFMKKKDAAADVLHAGDAFNLTPRSSMGVATLVSGSVPNVVTVLSSPPGIDIADGSDICAELDKSLARFQRSKSRQRAVELRSSVKAKSKGLSTSENARDADLDRAYGITCTLQEFNHADVSSASNEKLMASDPGIEAKGGHKMQNISSSSRPLNPTSSLSQVKSLNYSSHAGHSSDLLIERGHFLGKLSFDVPKSFEVGESSVRILGCNRRSETYLDQLARSTRFHQKSDHEKKLLSMNHCPNLTNMDGRSTVRHGGESTQSSDEIMFIPLTSDMSKGIAGQEVNDHNVENSNVCIGSTGAKNSQKPISSCTDSLSSITVEGSDAKELMGNLSEISQTWASAKGDTHDGVSLSGQIYARRFSIKDNVENISANENINITLGSQKKREISNSSDTLIPARYSQPESAAKPQGASGTLDVQHMSSDQIIVRPHFETQSDALGRSSHANHLKNVAQEMSSYANDLKILYQEDVAVKVSNGTQLSVPSFNYALPMEPKHLNFDDVEEYNPDTHSHECVRKDQYGAFESVDQYGALESVMLDPVDVRNVVSDSIDGRKNQPLGLILKGNDDITKLEADCTSNVPHAAHAAEVNVEMEGSPINICLHSSENGEVSRGNPSMNEKNCDSTIVRTMVEREEISKQLLSPSKLYASSCYSSQNLPNEREDCVISDNDVCMSMHSDGERDKGEVDGTGNLVSENITLNGDIISSGRKQSQEENVHSGRVLLTGKSISPVDKMITSTLTDDKNEFSDHDALYENNHVYIDKMDATCSKESDFTVSGTSLKRECTSTATIDDSWQQYKRRKTWGGLDTFFSASFLPVSPKFKKLGLHCTSSLTNEDTKVVDMDLSTSAEKDTDKESPIISEDLFAFGPLESHLKSNVIDQSMPVFEGFLMQSCGTDDTILEGGLSFEALSAVERASILEQLYQSATCTPIPQFPNTCRLISEPNSRNSNSSGTFQDDQSVSYVCPSQEMGKVCTSPVTKLWDGMAFKPSSDSSGKRKSSNPELTCFPIKEEESGNVEDAMDTYQESLGLSSAAKFTEGKLLDDDREFPTYSASVSEMDLFSERTSMASINTDITFSHTKGQVRQKLGKQESTKKMRMYAGKENQKNSVCSNNNSANGAHRSRVYMQKLSGKSSLRSKGQSLSERDPKKNNIVSNVSSFIPLVQQKQAATGFTGKRDIKVKALEAAEAAKRIEEQREHVRKMKKEALKLERARLDEQRQFNQKKKPMPDHNRKDNDVGMRKRAHEEQERRDKERKRKRIHEAQTLQRGDQVPRNADKIEYKTLVSKLGKMSQHEVLTSLTKVQSYELSPYHGSDDDDETDDNVPTRKYVPSWASKSRLSEVLHLQQGMDALRIFPKESFCSIIDVISGL